MPYMEEITSEAIPIAVLAVGVAAAFICGLAVWNAFRLALSARRMRKSVSGMHYVATGRETGSKAGGEGTTSGSPSSARSGRMQRMMASPEDMVISYIQRLSLALEMGKARKMMPEAIMGVQRKVFDGLRSRSGIGSAISLRGYCESQLRYAIAFGLAGACMGIVFSQQLSLVLFFVGICLGILLPGRALRARAQRRAGEMERHLPEMLDVIALGMRSGMSFDASLSLYGRHFDTMLAREMMNSKRQWESGLALREDALRNVAATYDSAVLRRTVETVIRSVRYGTSMVESIESDASEARTAYQADKEEKVAKAPVKMMVPTGVMILPAMLLLVLGPVLLELMEGGI